MTVQQVLEMLRSRRVHVRQFMGKRRYEVWIDDRCVSVESSPLNAESAIRRHLGITNADGIAVEQELERLKS